MSNANHVLDSLVAAIADAVVDRINHNGGVNSAPAPRALTIPQAAAYLSRTPAAVRRLINTGKLKAIRLDGRVFLDKQDLDRAIDEAKG